MKKILFIDDAFLNDNKTPRYKDIQDALINKDTSLCDIVVFMQKLPPIIETEGDRISYSCPELEDYAFIFLHSSISNIIKTDTRSYEAGASVISDLKIASKSTIITFSGGSDNNAENNTLSRDDNFIVKIIEFISYYKNNDSVINRSILYPNTKTKSEINLEDTHKYKSNIKDELNGSRWRNKLLTIKDEIKSLSELTNKDIMTELQSLTTPEEVRNYIDSL